MLYPALLDRRRTTQTRWAWELLSSMQNALNIRDAYIDQLR